MNRNQLRAKLRTALTGVIRNEFKKQTQIIGDSIKNEENSEDLLNYLRELEDSTFLEKGIESEIKEEERDRQFLAALAGKSIICEIVGHDTNGYLGQMGHYVRKCKSQLPELHAYYELFVSKYELLGSIIDYDMESTCTGEYTKKFIANLYQYYKDCINSGVITFTLEFLNTKVSYKRGLFISIFVNLITNAMNYGRDGIGRDNVRVIITRVGDWIIVADNGLGVPEENIPKLFQLYFKGERGQRGVGLYSIQQCLERNNGTIRYITDPAEKILPGANFAVRFDRYL